MELKALFYTIFKSLNPESHKELHEHKLGFAIKYFFFVLILFIFIMFILLIPSFVSINAFIENKTANFDKMDVNFSFSLKQSFNVLNDPLIRVDNQSNMSNEALLITQDGIYYRPIFSKPRLIPFDAGVDVRTNSLLKNTLSTMIWFMLPSLLLWSILFFAIYFIILILITYILALVFAWVFRIGVGWPRLLKSSIYASTILIGLQLVLMPYYRTIIIPVAAYWILMIIIILLLKDETQMHGRSNAFDNTRSAGSFGKSKKDSYDVDESGNLKSARRRRSVDEENEGFVELK
jgi:hypothetical protein